MKFQRLFSLIAILLVAVCMPLSALELGPVELHGSLSQGYIYSQHNNFIVDSTDGTADFREYGLNATIRPMDNVTIGGQIFGRDFGVAGNDEIFLDWLNIDYTWRNWLGFRLGKLKTPYGFYGETRDVDSLRTEILLPQGVYMEYIRGLFDSTWGGAVHGFVSSKTLGGFSYLAQGGVRDVDAQSSDMQRLLIGRGIHIDRSKSSPSFAIAFIWDTPVEGLRFGTTGSWSKKFISGTADSPFGSSTYESDIHDNRLLTGSVEYTLGHLTLAAEALSGSFDAIFDYASPYAPDMTLSAAYVGGYMKADYRFADWLAVAGGYSSFDFDQTVTVNGANGIPYGPSGLPYGENQDDWFLSIRFDITENLILKVEEHIISGISGTFAHENPDGTDKQWSMTMAKMSFVF
ncbi:MAG: hypothetical protein WCN95_05850 [bacterium]